MRNLFCYLLFCVFFASILPLLGPVFASHVLFQDNFDDQNSIGWEEHAGPGGNWSVTNGEYVGRVNQNALNTPSYALVGDINWTNYTFEASVKSTSGVDKGVRFRYKNADELYRVQLRSSPFNDLVIT